MCVQKAVAGGLVPCSLLLAASTGGLGVRAKNPPCRSERVQAPGLGMHAPPGGDASMVLSDFLQLVVWEISALRNIWKAEKWFSFYASPSSARPHTPPLAAPSWARPHPVCSCGAVGNEQADPRLWQRASPRRTNPHRTPSCGPPRQLSSHRSSPRAHRVWCVLALLFQFGFASVRLCLVGSVRFLSGFLALDRSSRRLFLTALFSERSGQSPHRGLLILSD